MAKEINLEDNHEQFANRHGNIIYRDHLEYTGSRVFWGSTFVLGAAAIFAALAYLVVQQLKK